MKEKPISFTAWSMTRILAGEKTATMRPMVAATGYCISQTCGFDSPDAILLARYRVGDILWPREPWRTSVAYDSKRPCFLPPGVPIGYVADGGQPGYPMLEGRLRRGMFLPKRFARPNRYEVLKVEVRRPQELTDEEIIAEGIRYPHAEVGKPLVAPEGWYQNAWYNLWLKIYGPKSWAANPLCWRYTFRDTEN